ncbi:MAG: pilus assembly PilX N-terminal domain-containing protein [Sedimentisphaerales bacterium]|nr:pilus assembly PilX N-terminal domain-containing protein [Sedimentisphaerales bacterium]
MLKPKKGIALVAALIFTLVLTILGFSVLIVASNEIILTRSAANKAKAFYLAEAGLEVFKARISMGNGADIEETSLGEGTYHVECYVDEDPPYAISTGTVDGQVKRIRVEVTFLAPPYECGIYAGGLAGLAWTLILSGTGNPTPVSGGEYNGKDIVNGNVFVDGDVVLRQQSSVNPAPLPNTFELEGDVNATGTVSSYDTSTIAGDTFEGSDPQDPPDLLGMNYAVNNTHNVAQYFADAGVTSGYLPSGNTLRNVFAINPSNMVAECATTPGNDYFLTPSTGFIGGNWKTAPTSLNVGDNRVYYVDGDVWVHSKSTFGFTLRGKATIVATGNIHLCDNIVYADTNSMLGLVALGNYEDGNLVSGGNVYFGDPVYGTMYTFSSMMFAANDFLYNTDPISATSAEPTSGFTITGNLAALNQVSIERDWYTKGSERRPARYDPATGKWYDSRDGTELTEPQIGTIKHYQMIVNYDDRVRSRQTQPPGLPRGVGLIFSGLSNWEEL